MYPVRLTESHFPAQTDDAIRDETLGREGRCADRTGEDENSHTGCGAAEGRLGHGAGDAAVVGMQPSRGGAAPVAGAASFPGVQSGLPAVSRFQKSLQAVERSRPVEPHA